jgi:propionate CoA-transferase
VQLVSKEKAASLLGSGDTLVISGSGGGHAVPDALLEALGNRFAATGEPRAITAVHTVGIGDRKTRGADHLAREGLIGRWITSAFVDSPALAELARDDRIEAYTLPQGVLSQLMREIAGGRPGLLSRIGLHTLVDPRQLGGRQSPSATLDLVRLLEVDGREWLFYPSLKLDVAYLRGTTADEDGNVTMEQEAVFGEMLEMAQATRHCGGIVVVQVKRLARRGTLSPKLVRIPGILVDYVVVVPEQRQTYATDYDPAYAGELRVPLAAIRPLPLGARKVIARRAALELTPGAVCNLGAGISTGIASVAAEEGVLDAVVLTNEQGLIGGAPLMGADSGAAQNFAAMISQPSQFDFYDGGGLDLAFLSFAEADASGSVNISRFGDRIVGIGGFINISQSARKVVFSATMTAGDLEIEIAAGGLRILREGRVRKFVDQLEQICFSGAYASERRQEILFVTERAVFQVVDGKLVLIEVAPGVDLADHVLGQMAFRPKIAEPLRTMDRRLFEPAPIGLQQTLAAAAQGSHARCR